MAKDKKASKAAVSAPKPEVTKSIKAGRVTKPSEQPKAVAKEAAKKAAKVEKKSKKAKKEPTPEPSSDEDDSTSSSSASSDEGSDSETETKTAPKTNGNAKVSAAAKSDSDDDASSSASDSDREAAPKMNGKAAATSESDDDSASSSDSDSGGGVDTKSGAEKLGVDAKMKHDSSDSGSSDDEDEDVKPKAAAKADAADSSDASSSSDEEDSEDDEEEEEKPKVQEPVGKKRKADDGMEQTPKKTKVTVNGEQKDAVGNLFIGNLSWNIDEEWLTREFEEYGEIKGVRIITDRESGRSKGFGYVEFTDTSSAVAALEARNGSLFDGREIRIDFSQPRQPRDDGQTPQQRSSDRAQRYGDTPKEPSTTIFVGNISFSADESMITEYFQEYGYVKAVRLPTDRESGTMKGFGYVEMSSIDEAKAALEALQGQDVGGRAVRLDYATTRSNDDSPRGGFGGRGGGRGRGGDRGGRGGFGDRGGRGGGRGGFNDRGRGGRGGRGGTTNRGGFGDFSGKKMTF